MSPLVPTELEVRRVELLQIPRNCGLESIYLYIFINIFTNIII